MSLYLGNKRVCPTKIIKVGSEKTYSMTIGNSEYTSDGTGGTYFTPRGEFVIASNATSDSYSTGKGFEVVLATPITFSSTDTLEIIMPLNVKSIQDSGGGNYGIIPFGLYDPSKDWELMLRCADNIRWVQYLHNGTYTIVSCQGGTFTTAILKLVVTQNSIEHLQSTDGGATFISMGSASYDFSNYTFTNFLSMRRGGAEGNGCGYFSMDLANTKVLYNGTNIFTNITEDE